MRNPCQVFSCTMYMGVFGSSSPKPHKLYSNHEETLQAISQRAGFMSRTDQEQCTTVPTTRRYVDRSGKRRRVGVPKALKESAYLWWLFSMNVSCTTFPKQISCSTFLRCETNPVGFKFPAHPSTRSGITLLLLVTSLRVWLQNIDMCFGFNPRFWTRKTWAILG